MSTMQGAALYSNWRDVVVFASDGPRPQKVLETDTFRAVIVGLEAGQSLPVHPAPASAYHFLEGTGWMTVDGERFRVGPGATVVAPDGAKRGVDAETRLAFLGTQAAKVTGG